MTDSNDDDLVMDGVLRERLGGESPPDLVAAVRTRLAVAGAPEPVTRRAARLWAAAAVLLGALVVVAIATLPRREAGGGAAGAQDPKVLVPVLVHQQTDVATLPADTRAVEAVGVDDQKFLELTRLRGLEVLIVREPWNESFGLSLKLAAPRYARPVTAAIWSHIAAFTKLRTLELHGTVHAGFFDSPGIGLQPADWSGDVRRVADVFAGLERLPGLENLTLRCMDTADIVLLQLPRLASLRRLDLSFNHGFEEAGIDAILQCRGLRSLSLRGCQQLHGRLLARLHELPELAELDVSAIDGINWRAGSAELFMYGARQLLERARRLADRIGMGPMDEALAGLARCPRLAVLDISGGYWTTDGIASLGACRSLRDLRATGGQGHGAGWVAALPSGLERLEVGGGYSDAFCDAIAEHLTSLRHLNISACDGITDRGLARVAKMPSLRALDMRQMRGLTVASIDVLLAAPQLEELDVRHCAFVTAAHVVALRRALPKLRLLETSVPEEEIAAAQTAPGPVQVRTREEAAALPRDVRHVVASDIEDDCLAELAKLRALERLDVVAAWSSPVARRSPRVPPLRTITDDGLRLLRGTTSLRSLQLDGQLGVEGAGLDVVRSLVDLEEVTLSSMRVTDDGLAEVARLPRLRALTVRHSQGFGRAACAAITSAVALRELSLAGCVHLEAPWLVPLGVMPRLEVLDLSMIGSHTWFSGFSAHLPPPDPGSGVTDEVLVGLVRNAKLRVLSLGQAGITAAGVASLGALPALTDLDLSGVPVDSASLRVLPGSLERLTLRGCVDDFAGLGEVLATATPKLETLDLLGSRVGKAGFSSLLALQSLRTLDLSYCQTFGVDSSEISAEAAVAGLVAMPWLEGLTIRGWMPLADADLARVRAMPNLRRLDTDAGTEALRPR